jgi:histidinol-phosphate/aromatic aminotransferase/cobyric acid decarboxylase-like protein
MLFRLVHSWQADTLSSMLRRYNILIRNCSNFKGLGPEYIRISPRLSRENDMLVTSLMNIVGNQGVVL